MRALPIDGCRRHTLWLLPSLMLLLQLDLLLPLLRHGRLRGWACTGRATSGERALLRQHSSMLLPAARLSSC